MKFSVIILQANTHGRRVGFLKSCPHCRRKVRLSHKSETVAENGETTAKFGDCRTFLRQYGQALT